MDLLIKIKTGTICDLIARDEKGLELWCEHCVIEDPVELPIDKNVVEERLKSFCISDDKQLS